jgi:rhamnogalacturonyl hydrolase YesR
LKKDIQYLFRCALLLLVLAVGGHGFAQQGADALSLAREVADRFVKDTRFDFVYEPQEEVLGMQVVDFRQLGLQVGQKAYAYCQTEASTDTLVRFGVSSGVKIKIWVNDEIVFEQGNGMYAPPREIAYGKFRFGQYFTALQHKGVNKWLIELEPVSAAARVVLLRPQTVADDLDLRVIFKGTNSGSGWLYTGPFTASQAALPATKNMQPFHLEGPALINWQNGPQRLLPTLRIDPTAIYQRESYANWHYSHGLTVWSIWQLAQATGNNSLDGFVKRYTDFVLTNSDYFKKQYEELYAYRGTLHRLFRRTMLDDTGAPILPFAALYSSSSNPVLRALVDSIGQVVRTEQLRLADGTFCRPEPVAYTVWADDLFMSVPFLSIMAKATGNASLFDEATKQVLQFQQYLFIPATGLYKHGWFSTSREQSVAYWGRANGWIIWATAELLNVLPTNHRDYKKVLGIFRQHAAALVKYQQSNGMWRQLLDRPGAYEETSCTAMFTLAMARGVRMGWLGKEYSKYALLAWQAVARQIEGGGIVHGICRGTEIGFDEAFYLNRKQLDNDPRGLGAVITAAIEISKLDSKQKTNKGH